MRYAINYELCYKIPREWPKEKAENRRKRPRRVLSEEKEN